MNTPQRIVVGLILIFLALFFGNIGQKKGEPTMQESFVSGFSRGLSTWGAENAAAGKNAIRDIDSQRERRSLPFYILAGIFGVSGVAIMLFPNRRE